MCNKKRHGHNCFRCWGKPYRYCAIAVICILGLGSYISYDTIGALQGPLMKHANLTTTDYTLLLSINSWPNIFLSFIGGFIIDRFLGVKAATVIYSTVFTSGQYLFAMGVFCNQFWLMILGRFILGVGLEQLIICIQCNTMLWFKGKEISLSICLSLCVSKIGSSIMFAFAAPLFNLLERELTGIQAVGIFHVVVGIFSIFSLISSIFLKYMEPSRGRAKSENETLATSVDQPAEKLVLKDILNFPLLYWLIIVIQCSYITLLYTFLPLSQGFFMTKFDITMESANKVLSFFSIFSATIGPFVGITVDKFGRIIFFLTFGIVCTLLAHALFLYGYVTPYVGMGFFAIGYILNLSSVFPLLAYIIPPNQLGTAAGMMIAVSNLAYSVNQIISGVIIDNHGMDVLEFYLLSWGILCLLIVVCLYFRDRKRGGVLNMSPAQRKHHELSQMKIDEVSEPLNITLTNENPKN